ncbi:hypothetical protein EV2_025170 [Malus domestica]
MKVRRRTIIHTGQSSRQQIQKNEEYEIPKEDVTFGSFDSKSSPRPLGAYSKSSEVEGWTHVAPKKLHEKHTSYPQVHQSERGQSSFRQPTKQCESVEDKEISAQRSFMRDLFFLEDLFKYSTKAPCYEDCEERLSKIASKKWTSSNHFVHKFISRKWGKAVLVNLQNSVEVLEIMKFRHKNRPSPSQCVISFQKTSSITQSRFLAMRIMRNALLEMCPKANHMMILYGHFTC